MPFISTSQEWFTQSRLLVEARPTTTRITVKYNVRPAKKRVAAKRADQQNTPTADAASAKPPRANLVIKTFDPHSGVCLKYKTTKAAEVSRLVQLLGELARKMAALPDAPAPAVAVDEDVGMSGTATPPVAEKQTGQQPPAAGVGGTRGKKKKGKR